jgi:hypothetical protein
VLNKTSNSVVYHPRIFVRCWRVYSIILCAAHSFKCWYCVYGLFTRQPTLWSFKKGGGEHDVTPQLCIQGDADDLTHLPHRFKYTKKTASSSILFMSTCCGNRGGNRTSTFRSLIDSRHRPSVYLTAHSL